VAIQFSDRLSFARKLRRDQTDAERRIWSRLRNRRVRGCKFRRQFPIGPYYGDFVCLEIGLVVELDGGQHNDERHRRSDAIRSDLLVARGFEVLRFWDNDVMRDTDAIIAVIARRIEALTRAAPDLSRKRER
jgi:very-short-patch-repair endonuclease